MEPENLPPSSLIPLQRFLHDIQRSEGYFRDHYDDAEPRLPRLLYQGSSKFVSREEADAYKRDLKRRAGAPMRGRPRKKPSSPVAAE